MDTLSPTAFADRVIMARQRAREEHERIFGRKSFRQMAMEDISSNRFVAKGTGTVSNKKIKGGKRKAKKTLCPHCATHKFMKVSEFTRRCTKCKYEN